MVREQASSSNVIERKKSKPSQILEYTQPVPYSIFHDAVIGSEMEAYSTREEYSKTIMAGSWALLLYLKRMGNHSLLFCLSRKTFSPSNRQGWWWPAVERCEKVVRE